MRIKKESVMKIQIIKATFFLGLLYQQQMHSSNLDGTSAIVYKNQHHVFSNGESARGYVRMNGGFTVKPDASATLDTVVSVSGPIDLRNTGAIQLLKDLELDSGVTLSNGGFINGRGSAIILNDTLIIPASKKITFTGDTVIDGKGNWIIFKEHAQLSTSKNVTVTLRNCSIQNTRNSLTIAGSFLFRADPNSKLVFDNVSFNLGANLPLQTPCFFHNTVKFTGTSTVILTSSRASFVAPASTLYFDKGTSFTYAPRNSSDNTLLKLQSKTSKLHFNGCNFSTSSTGIRLTKGTIIFENKVNINSNTDNGVQVPSNAIIFGNSAVGASENINVEILGAAHLTINGIVNDDSV